MTSSNQRIVKIATRKSALALWQANTVKSLLEAQNVSVELLPMVTTGDKMQKGALADVVVDTAHVAPHLQTGKGLFVKEIQESLLANNGDIAVHSMKDLPAERTQGLTVACVLPRADARDVLILSPLVEQELQTSLKALSPNLVSQPFAKLPHDLVVNGLLQSDSFRTKVIGTTSARRQMQLSLSFSTQLNLQILRGNVDTRLARLRNNEFAAILLAKAGLDRLGLFDERFMYALPSHSFIPAPAQGVIAIESRASDPQLIDVLARLCSPDAMVAAALERLALALLGGDCHMAVAAHYTANTLSLRCGKDSKVVSSTFNFESEHQKIIQTLREKSGHVYSAFFESLNNSKVKQDLYAHLKTNNYAPVSHLE